MKLVISCTEKSMLNVVAMYVELLTLSCDHDLQQLCYDELSGVRIFFVVVVNRCSLVQSEVNCQLGSTVRICNFSLIQEIVITYMIIIIYLYSIYNIYTEHIYRYCWNPLLSLMTC